MSWKLCRLQFVPGSFRKLGVPYFGVLILMRQILQIQNAGRMRIRVLTWGFWRVGLGSVEGEKMDKPTQGHGTHKPT